MESLTGTEFQSDRKVRLDYLTFWAYGEFKEAEELEIKLETNQAIAREKVAWYCKIGKHEFRVYRGGTKGNGVYFCRWGVECSGIYVGVCPFSDEDDRPAVKVEIKGQALLLLGEKEAVKLAFELLESLGLSVDRTKVSRTDICGDFESFAVRDLFQLWDRGCAVSLARKHVVYRGQKFQDIESFYVGMNRKRDKGDICIRFYDKWLETETSPEKRQQLEQIVLQGAQVDRLTRVEIQFNRQSLKKRYCVETVEDLFASLEIMIEDVTINWCRVHKQELTEGNTARKKHDDDDHHSIWRTIRQELKKLAGCYLQRKPRFVERREQTVERQERTLVSWLVKVAAVKDLDVRTWSDVFRILDAPIESVCEGLKGFKNRVVAEKKKIESSRMADVVGYFETRHEERIVKQKGLEFLC